MARSGRKAREPCPGCGAPFERAAVGRPKRYCSNACRQRAYRLRRDGEQTRGLLRLVEADARKFLPTLPDESVDLIVTDPPYEFDRGDQRFRRWFDASIGDEEWPAIFAELYRLLRRDAHAYVIGDQRVYPVFAQAALAAGFRVRRFLIWDKGSIGLGGLWRPQSEVIGVFEKGRRPGNFRNRGDVIRARRVVRGYPTEKPVTLLAELIEQSSDPRQLVLDPFCGSGSTGRAARRLGRRAVLVDLDAGAAAARLRIRPIQAEDKPMPLRWQEG